MIHCILIIGSSRFDTGLSMLKSASNPDVKIYVVWRGFSEIPSVPSEIKPFYEVSVTDCSLSKGRNILLQQIFNSVDISDDEIVCFADDDGLWPPDLPEKLKLVFAEEVFWALGRYGPANNVISKRFPSNPISSLSLRKLLMLGSSLGIYARVGLLKSIGLFDEFLGLGTDILIGEDTDFLIRLYKHMPEAQYRPELFQIHEFGNEVSLDRMKDSLEFYIHIMRKGTYLPLEFFQRTLVLRIRGIISSKEAFRFARRWIVTRLNPDPVIKKHQVG